MSEEVTIDHRSDDEDMKEVVEKLGNTKVDSIGLKVNCPEHIILVVDLCRENGNTPYKLADGSKFSAIMMVKRALSLFLCNKHAIDSRHKFALVVLQDIPKWVLDFTDDPEKIIGFFNKIEEEQITPSNFDLSVLFELLANQITFPHCSNPSVAPPPYIYRTILIYGRSHCLPQFLNEKKYFTELIQSPHFFLDVLYLHEPPSDNNKCEGIFDLLCSLDEGGLSYVLEVSRNATKLHNYFGTLLAHPFQRPAQKDLHYTLSPDQ